MEHIFTHICQKHLYLLIRVLRVITPEQHNMNLQCCENLKSQMTFKELTFSSSAFRHVYWLLLGHTDASFAPSRVIINFNASLSTEVESTLTIIQTEEKNEKGYMYTKGTCHCTNQISTYNCPTN